jgi:starch-binding outer membrane protein, SusD/RagB family
MKTRFFRTFILLGFVLAAASCKKALDESPNNAIPAQQAIVDASTANAAIVGTYSELASYYAANYPILGSLPADNVIFNGTLSQYLQLDQNAIPADNVVTVAVFQGIYKTINTANNVIASVPSVTDINLTTAQKNQILGEAYFIRALGYFDLGRGWGGVPIVTNPTTTVSSIQGIGRSTLAQTYAQVQSDLLQAQQLLPEDATTRNRAQKSASRALLARLALYQKDWADAESYATQVISNTKYTLVKPYKTFFTPPFLSSESVFELTFDLNDKNSFWNLWYPSSLGGQYTLKPSTTIITALNDPNVGGDRSALIAGSGSSVYGVLYNTSASSIDPSYVIRIAELYLIRAEARAQQGDLTDALADLNAVRNRASVPNSTAVTQSEILLAIENENSVEFAFEGHRWFDLVRTGRAGAVLGLTNQNYWLFPIPLSDVLADPTLKQNPGY